MAPLIAADFKKNAAWHLKDPHLRTPKGEVLVQEASAWLPQGEPWRGRGPGLRAFPLTVPLCSQEKRIASLDAANARLMSALTQLKERYSMQTRNGISPTNPTKLQITENGEFRNSSNC